MSKHTVTMVFEDGRTVQIQADENDTIYLASLRNKIRLMTDISLRGRSGSALKCWWMVFGGT